MSYSNTATDPTEREDDFEAEAQAAPEAEAPEPEAQSETGQDAEPKPAPRHVPLAEVIRERQARQAAQEENRQLRDMLEKGNSRLESLVRDLAPKAPPQPVPDLNTDPVGHFQHENQQLRQQLAEIAEWKRNVEQQGQAGSQEQQFVARYTQDAVQFSQTSPDFGAAYEHVKQSLVRDYLEAGYTMPEAIGELQNREREIAQKAFREGRSPAEAIYKLAKARGFSAPKPDGAARMETMQRGQQAARTVAGPSRGTDYAGLTLAQLVAMPDDEFAKVPERIRNRLAGG